jgi:hyperosmotically inducible protein
MTNSKLFRIITLLMALNLVACAPAVIVAAGAGAYYVATDERTVATLSSDATITSSVKTKFIKDEHIKAFDINVDTYESVVTLHGNVPSEAVKERAIKLASSVKGVKKIVTKLVVVPLQP